MKATSSLALPLTKGKGTKHVMSMIHNNKIFKDRRVELRKRQTPQEEKLWQEIRNNKLGFKFKRQHSIGGYITDFYCAQKKLVIEIDGEVHESADAKEYDEARDKFIKNLGFKTIRFENKEVENNLQKVVESIKYLLTELPSTL